jgi:hypothetical protein
MRLFLIAVALAGSFLMGETYAKHRLVADTKVVYIRIHDAPEAQESADSDENCSGPCEANQD